MKRMMRQLGLGAQLVLARLWRIVGFCKDSHDAALQRKLEMCW